MDPRFPGARPETADPNPARGSADVSMRDQRVKTKERENRISRFRSANEPARSLCGCELNRIDAQLCGSNRWSPAHKQTAARDVRHRVPRWQSGHTGAVNSTPSLDIDPVLASPESGRRRYRRSRAPGDAFAWNTLGSHPLEERYSRRRPGWISARSRRRAMSSSPPARLCMSR